MEQKQSPEYMHKYYLAHRAERKRYRDAHRTRVRKEVEDLKRTTPCEDCGRNYHPAVMEFDHVRGAKSKNVSRMLDRSRELLFEEIAKCDLVCANCHRMRTVASGLYDKTYGSPQ